MWDGERFSNDDKNVKKEKGLINYENIFWYIPLPSLLVDNDEQSPLATFYWGQTYDNKFLPFFLLFLNLSAGSKNSTPGKFAFWYLKRVGINATKFENK